MLELDERELDELETSELLELDENGVELDELLPLALLLEERELDDPLEPEELLDELGLLLEEELLCWLEELDDGALLLDVDGALELDDWYPLLEPCVRELELT